MEISKKTLDYNDILSMCNETLHKTKNKYLKYKQKYLKLSALIQIDSKKSI